jgi:hypothetical protein
MGLANVRKGPMPSALRVLIYGAEKIGKSSFAADAPAPIFLGKDLGTEHLDVVRFPQPETWSDVLEAVAEIERGGHPYKTLVVDPVGWLEPLIHFDVTGDLSVPLSKYSGGYGRGNEAAFDRWRALLSGLERAWLKGYNVVLVAHATVRKFEDPEGLGYERYELEMGSKRAAGALKQWSDAILFAKRESFARVDKDTKQVKAAGGGMRVVHTEWTPAYDAGNRFSLPATLPLSWQAFAEAVAAGPARRMALLHQVDADLAQLGDAEVEAKVRAYLAAGGSAEVAANSVREKLNPQPQETT